MRPPGLPTRRPRKPTTSPPVRGKRARPPRDGPQFEGHPLSPRKRTLLRPNLLVLESRFFANAVLRCEHLGCERPSGHAPLDSGALESYLISSRPCSRTCRSGLIGDALSNVS